MAVTKEVKAEMYQTYMKALENTVGMVVTEYRGMNMKMVSQIRAALRPVGGRYSVVKSTIFQIALRDTGFAAPKEMLRGPIAVAIADTDLAKVAKAILAIKDQPLLILKGAIMGKTVFQAEQLEAVSTMPTLDEARASLIGTLISPISGLVGLLAQPAQGFAQILKAYTDKQQEETAA